MDDLRIPLNDTVHSQRYRDAVPMMRGVDVVVGHSLGGAVALSLSERYNVLPITYGAPVLDLNPFDPSGSHRHRCVGDPVAFLDLAAQTSLPAFFSILILLCDGCPNSDQSFGDFGRSGIYQPFVGG